MRETLSVIRSECERSAVVMRKAVRHHQNEGDEGLSAFHPFSEERRIFGTAGEIISMHSKTDLHIWRGSVFAWDVRRGISFIFL